MVDVSKVEGPSGSPESFGKKDKGSVEADKFKDAMRKRVSEVSQIDPDEQKKRKRREEAEEEEPADGTSTGPATPPSQVTPFSLEKEQKKVSPLDMQGPGTPPTESAQKVSMTAPSSDEMADDSGVLEEEAFVENIPSPASQGERPVSQPPLAPQPPISEGMTPPTRQPSVAAPAESGQPETGQQPPGKQPARPPVGPPPEKKSAPAGIGPGLGRMEETKQAAPVPEKKGTTGAEVEQAGPAKARDTSGFFEQLGQEGGEKEGKKPAKTPEELAQEAALQGTAPSQPTPFAPAPEEGKKEKPVEEAGLGAPPAVPGELPGIALPPATPEALPSYANIHPQVMELFDRMVGVMTVMSMSGVTETVITLNAPQFASSVFFGSQIIIQEYSTAPHAYNIQLIGTPQAVALFQGNADDLMAAFQAGNYNFRINRLETGYLTDRPLFKRKEKAGGEKEAGGGTQ
jgi:hypothetical protein